MITIDLVLVLLVVVFILVSLSGRLVGISFTLLIGIIALGVFGILTPSEIINGLGNEQVAVVILVLLYSDVLRKTGLVEKSFDRIFRRVKTYRGFISRMVLSVSAFSMVMNNIPLVTELMPYVNSLAKRNHFSPSKFLIPLSYAAILGGSATLIGTTTNLIVNSMIQEQTLISDLKNFNIFDFMWVGVPLVIIGWLYLTGFSQLLLPARKVVTDNLKHGEREYMVEAKVSANSHLIGKTVGEAGLYDIQGLMLISIVRKSFRITEVPTDVVLDRGDTLVFAGETRNIAELITKNSGLVLPEVGMLSKVKRANVSEVVVSQNSSLINKSVRDTDFRGRFDAAIIAVHRNGEEIEGKAGNVILKSGDVLLLFAGENFISRSHDTKDFYFISNITEYIKLDWYKSVILIGGTLLVILLAALNLVPLFMGLLIMLLVSMIFKLSHPREVPVKIDYNLALVIVLSLALGTAMIKSGAAAILAGGLISVFLPFGKAGVLCGIYLLTGVLAATITTKASIALVFPVALSMAQQLGVNAEPLLLAVAYAAACNFVTPQGDVINLIVYGPGGYRKKDFLKIGLPLAFLCMAVTVLILSARYF